MNGNYQDVIGFGPSLDVENMHINPFEIVQIVVWILQDCLARGYYISGKIFVWFKRLQIWKTWGPISLDEWSPCPKRGLFFHCLLQMSLWSLYGLMLRDFWENNRHNQSHDRTHVTPGAQQPWPCCLPSQPTMEHESGQWPSLCN